MSRLRLTITLPAAVAAAALLGACSSSGGGSSASSAGTQAPSAATSAAGAPASGKTITAKLTEFHIALSSEKLTPGTYTFKVTNAGKITHALTVNGNGVDDKGTKDLDAGQSASFTVTLAAGKYDVFCPVGDHKMEGMDETVSVG